MIRPRLNAEMEVKMKLYAAIPLLFVLAGCSSGGSSEGEVSSQNDETVAELPESDSENYARMIENMQSAYNAGEVWECISVEIRASGSDQVDRLLSNWNEWAFSYSPESGEFISYTDVAESLDIGGFTLNYSYNINKQNYFRRLVMSPDAPDLNWFERDVTLPMRFSSEKVIFGYYVSAVNGLDRDFRCIAKEYSVVTVVNELISTLPVR